MYLHRQDRNKQHPLRRYLIDGYDKRDGSLIGKFRARRGDSVSQPIEGLVKLVVIPENPNAYYLMEYDSERDVPPVTGIIRSGVGTSTKLSYFYGMLMGMRAGGEERIVAVKCLILREDAMKRANEKVEDILGLIDTRSFSDEVTESEVGEYRWKLLKYYFNGIDRSDGPECLHTWIRFSYLGTNGRIREEVYLGDLVAEIYLDQGRISLPASIEMRYLDLLKNLEKSFDRATTLQLMKLLEAENHP
jgi:hypothetical protein